MRQALWVLIAAAGLAAAHPAPAAAGNYAFCLMGCDFGGNGDCSFSTYQQCQASASGREATCAANPYFNARAEVPPNYSRVPKRRF
jgi:hypothetical protein